MSLERRRYYQEQRILPILNRLEENAITRRRDKLQQPIVERTAKRVRGIFRTQQREFLRRMDTEARQLGLIESSRLSEAGMPDWAEHWLDTVLATLEAFEAGIREAHQLSLLAGAREMLASMDIDIAFDLENPRAAAYAAERAAAQVTKINETTRSEIQRLITGGVRDGRSYSEIAQDIRTNFKKMRTPQPQKHLRDRAEAIAVYEVGDAYEAGTRAAVEEASGFGLQFVKSWLTVSDDRVRAEHRENQGAGWIEKNDTFPSGHDRPPTDPGCRCTLLWRRKRTEEA